ncbi:MAG TPA: UDP-N-acetylmuramoyl-tripeptide--D-alanyl-D-alanine ligase [Candidatus Binataceae bacterium]|nr:UDP-N-acetylmuramoyl-tripeptide--D-alanyl-D-alanine ligase [Candidatus Binataceae bacterium]
MATPIPKNHCEFTLAEVADACGGSIHGDPNLRIRGISIDTRTIAAGEMFVALRGAAIDGHRYLAQAAERGAAAAIVEPGKRHATLPCIEVADPLIALGDLARRHLERRRAAHRIPVAAIGGAAGKTTTKELTALAARALFGETLSTPGNLNNRIGVPMTIFTLTERHRAAVLECGTNMRGEIAHLAKIVEPDAAMVLNVDLEHTEGLGTLDDVADEECTLFSTARRFAIAPAGDPLIIPRIPARLEQITFGKTSDATVRLADRIVGANGRAKIRIDLSHEIGDGARKVESEINLLGEAAALNCTAAIAMVAAMRGGRLSASDLRALGNALETAVAVPGRLAATTIGGAIVIDDTYNSNPRSIRAALDAAREVAAPTNARLVIAMGDMLELGAISPDAHRAAVRDVLAAKPATFVAVGAEMAAAIASLVGSDLPGNIVAAVDSAQAGPIVARTLQPGDIVLVKGSRGIAMEKIIGALRK